MDFDDYPATNLQEDDNINTDDESEEYYVYVDFGTHLPFDELVDAETNIKIIGLDTDTPLAQVNGRFYQGDYEYAMGTKMFFEEADEDERRHWFGEKHTGKMFRYAEKTNKVLTMKRIFVTAKNGDTAPVVFKSEEGTQNKKYEVTSTYTEVLNRFLPTGVRPPREIPPEEDGGELLLREQKGDADDGDVSSGDEIHWC